MPKIVVRKSYRCQPGRRREVLTALQKMDAAVAEAGYPRGRYVLVETRAPGEPDLEVEFTFESYAEMERLDRAMRERVGRYLREGGATGQEHLLEPSATKHVLLVEDGAGAARSAAPERAATEPAPQARGAPPQRQATPTVPTGTNVPGHGEPADLTLDEDDEEGFDAPPESEVPPPPEIPDGMTRDEFQQAQQKRARAALHNAERTVGVTRQAGQGVQPPTLPRRPPDQAGG